MSVFYDHLVGLDELHSELLPLNLAVTEHYQLLKLIDSTLHHEILSVCLDCLPIEHHEPFITRFNSQPDNGELLIFLKEKDPEIEEKITRKSREVKEKIKADLRKAKKN